MPERSPEIQYLMDRAAIQDLHARYFNGLDRCNPEQVRSCFTQDVRAYYDQRAPVKGIEELMTGFRTFERISNGVLKLTTHFMGNLNIRSIDGDVAETETNAIAFLVETADVVQIRSLRYIDTMRRQAEGWRISDRVHTLDWSCRMPTDYAITLGQRLWTVPARAG